MPNTTEVVAGVVLAGGQSRRMGRHKALIEIGGITLLERAHARLRGFCDPIAVSIREAGPISEFAARFCLPTVFDPPATNMGPLCGVVAGLLWAKGAGAQIVLTIPCDAAFLPPDLPARLIGAVANGPCAAARTTQGVEPLCAAWRMDMIAVLQAECDAGRHPPVQAILQRAQAVYVDFPEPERFLNINTPQDVAAAEALMPSRPHNAP